MQILGFITESESEQAKSEPLPEKQDNSIASKTYLSGVYAEMESLPLYSPYQYRGGCKIYTYMDSPDAGLRGKPKNRRRSFGEEHADMRQSDARDHRMVHHWRGIYAANPDQSSNPLPYMPPP